MEKLVIEHKESLKSGLAYLFFAAVFAAMLFVIGDQLVMSFGSVVIVLALVIELTMAVLTLITAGSREELDPQGVTLVNIFGSKTYLWTDVERFEINWNYERKKTHNSEEVPFILLRLKNTKKVIKFAYTDEIDQCIRINYGQPHKDEWTTVGK